jgi:serine/threonine protein kinase
MVNSEFPEGAYNNAVDWWSLGILIFEMSHNELPWSYDYETDDNTGNYQELFKVSECFLISTTSNNLEFPLFKTPLSHFINTFILQNQEQEIGATMHILPLSHVHTVTDDEKCVATNNDFTPAFFLFCGFCGPHRTFISLDLNTCFCLQDAFCNQIGKNNCGRSCKPPLDPLSPVAGPMIVPLIA